MERLHLAELGAEQIRRVYSTWMIRDFADDERKPLDRIVRALQRGEYRCIGLFTEEQICIGYAFLVMLKSAYLLDYFAIDVPHRDKGFGSAFLRMLVPELSGMEMLLIETEDPAAAVSEKERIQRDRRIRFYENAGCCATGVSACVYGVDYLLWELPLSGTHTAEQVRDAYAALYHIILPDEFYKKWVVIR